jgi:chaperonin GroEL
MIKTTYSAESREQVVEGINKVAKAVVATLGPYGRNVIVPGPENKPILTKDGITVAKSFTKIENPVENIGAQLVIEASDRSARASGDGTTTTVLLTKTIVNEGIKFLSTGNNPVEIKKGIDKTVKEVVKTLREISIDVTTEAQIKQVATVSANNDEEIGNLIAEAFKSSGKDGIVTIEESKTHETTLEIVEGMQFERGYKSPFFVTNNNNMTCVLENPYILIYEKKFNQVKELLPILEAVSQQNKPLLVIAEDVEGEALATMVVNKARGLLKVCAVKAPEFGDRRLLMLEDIAVLTGGTVISPDKGHKLNQLTIDMLGQARMVAVTKDETTIIDGKGDIDKIAQRAEELKAQIDNSVSSYEIEKLQERLSRLCGGVAIINVGANTEIEMKEKKDRVEDALHATKAAISEGIVPGGGTALLRCISAAESIAKTLTPDQAIGANIIIKSLKAPFIQILENAGVDDYYKYMSKVIQSKDKFYGYNLRKDKFVNMLDDGIIDPTKVTRTAIENASSVGGTLLTLEAVVYNDDTDKEQTDNPLGNLM